jgi:type II secretory pathway pseudopilin PulG
MQKRIGTETRIQGTTLIEVLVVMVIFLLGILAVIQIFPGGLRILSQSRDRAVASARARAESEFIKGNSDQLPERILPVTATWTAMGIKLEADSNRLPNELGPNAAGIDGDGNLLDGSGNILGPWQLLTGANAQRRIIGEGGLIPSPRAVGSLYGGLMILRYAPVVVNSNYPEYFEVYGNDMNQRYGDPAGWRTRNYDYFVDELDNASAVIYLPRSTTKTRSYRISLSALVKDGSSNLVQRDIVTTTPISVSPDASGGYESFKLTDYVCSGAETLVSIDSDSMRVARLFDQVTSFSADPYEYQMLDSNLGSILFNPTGFNYKERRQNGRLVPLMGRVNYYVYDWRILKEDFRIPSTDRPLYQLIQGNLMITGKSGADGLTNPGLPLSAGQVSGRPALALLDLDTGGIYASDSIQVDGSRGVITFIDKDGDTTNGVQMDLLYPGATATTTITATGRSVRVLYMLNGEWAVQVMKAPSQYSRSWDAPGVAQFYVGGSNASLSNPGNSRRIYLPWNDLGKKVSVETIYYRRTGDDLNLAPREMNGQDFVISSDTDSFGPFIDIQSVDPDAAYIDLSYYGYGARNVKGASISVRVLWNLSSFKLTGDSAENMRRFNVWMGEWRKSETETYLQRSEN